MNTIEKLEKLQDYMEVLDKNNKIIKNGSYLYLLKKMKKNYIKTKEIYLKDKEKLQKIKEEYETVSKDIKKHKMDASDKIVYVNGVIKEIDNSNNKNIKTKIAVLERKGDMLLTKTEELIEVIEELRIKLINDKNNYISFKDKVDSEINNARKEIENITIQIQNIKKDISEYLFNKFMSIYKISGIGIVKNKNGICSNCKNNVVEYLNTEVSGDMEIISCPVCGGIMHIFNTNKKVLTKISV